MEQTELIQYTDYIFQMAIQKCKEVVIAEDLTQEVVLAGLIAISKGKEIDNPKQWLGKVLQYKYCDWLRRKYNKPTISYDAATMEKEDTFNCLEDLMRKEDAEAIRRELAYLSYTYREVMVRYYMNDESVGQIAEALGIPIGTVKSRLDVGRKQVKKGVEEMEKYTKQSYAPQKLHLGMSGGLGLNNEPLSLVKGDKIAENILILAYVEPIAVGDLAKQLGISMGYVEPVVDKLVNGELMQRTPSGKVYTDFIIHTEKDYHKPLNKQKQIVAEHFGQIWAVVAEALDEVRALPIYQRSSEQNRARLELYCCVDIMDNTMHHIRGQVAGTLPYSDYPYRENGGRWFAMGTIGESNPNDPVVVESRQYEINGKIMLNTEFHPQDKCVQLTCYETNYGKSPVGRIEGLGEVDLLRLLYNCYTGEQLDKLYHNVYFLRYIPELEQMGVMKKEEGRYKLELPVLTNMEYLKINELVERYVKQIMDQVGDALVEVYREGEVQLPKHLKSVPEWLRYGASGSLIPMMIIKQAIDKGKLNINEDYPVPAMLFIVD